LSSTTLPEYVTEVIERINKLTSTSSTDLQAEFSQILLDPYFSGPDFKTDEQKFRYAANMLWARYRARRPVKEFTVIPIGYEGFRYAKANKRKYSNIYVLNTERRIKKVGLYGTEAELYKTITLGSSYKVKLTEGKDGNLGADSRTRFENPQVVPTDLMSIYQKVLKVPEVPDLASCATLPYPSKMVPSTTGGKPFVDSLDWRIVKGIVTGSSSGKRKDDDSEWGSYRLIDQSLGTEEKVNPDGSVTSTTFSVWLEPTLMNWGTESEVYCIGTIGINDKKEASMNAVSCVAIFGRVAK